MPGLPLGGLPLSVMANRHAKGNQKKTIGFAVQPEWATGPRTPAWEELWRRLLVEVLNHQSAANDSITNWETPDYGSGDEEKCRNRFVDRLEQSEELGDGA